MIASQRHPSCLLQIEIFISQYVIRRNKNPEHPYDFSWMQCGVAAGAI
jgi:hypothetical protein